MAEQTALFEAVSALEKTSDEAQRLVKELLYETMFHKKSAVGFAGRLPALREAEDAGFLFIVDDPDVALQALGRPELIARLVRAGVSGFKKNWKLSELADWCVNSGVDVIAVSCGVGVAVLSPWMDNVKRKVYSYLLRKYDSDSYFDPHSGEMRDIPHGAEFVAVVGLAGSSLSLSFPDDEVTALLDKYGKNRCRGWAP